MSAFTDRHLHASGGDTLLHVQQCGTVHSRSKGMVFICSRNMKIQVLAVKKRLLEKAQKQPDPRQKAPELQKAIQSCSHDMSEMVLMLMHVWTLACLMHSLQCHGCFILVYTFL